MSNWKRGISSRSFGGPLRHLSALRVTASTKPEAARRGTWAWLTSTVLAGFVLCGANGHAVETLPGRSAVRAATERLRADPNLPGVKTEKSLRFKDPHEAPAEKNPEARGDLAWLRNLIAFVTESARALVWAAGALAVALLAVGARRWVQVRGIGSRHRLLPMPSHVGQLDIRPESLPDDIGMSAADLWQRGQKRPALSLLYRGALSRLVHLHAVPVCSGSTEGESLALVRERLAIEPFKWFERLVAAWQMAAYGGRLPATPVVLALCADFERHFPSAAVPLGGER